MDMKHLIISSGSVMEQSLTGQLIKDGEEVFVLTSAEHKSKINRDRRAHYYWWNDLDFSAVFSSVLPDQVIFCAGEAADPAAILRHVMDCSQQTNVNKFILVSSVSVYGEAVGMIDESVPVCPADSKGIQYTELEFSLGLKQNQFERTVIARIPEMLPETDTDLSQTVFAEYARQLEVRAEITAGSSPTIQWLCPSDISRAISLLAQAPVEGIYNIASKFPVSEYEIFTSLKKKLKSETTVTPGICPARKVISRRLFADTEWFERGRILSSADRCQIAGSQEDEVKKQSFSISPNIRKGLEIVLLGGFFAFMQYFSMNSEVFAAIQWMIVYVVLASLIYDVKWSTMSSLTAAVVHLIFAGVNPFAADNFYLLAGNILVVVQYLVIGLTISYSTTLLKNRIQDEKTKRKLLNRKFNEIKTINAENVLIKSEYEKQILKAERGIATIYSFFHPLTECENREELFETAVKNAVEMIGAKAGGIALVSPVYSCGDPLFATDASRTIRIKNTHAFRSCMKKQEVYLGNPFEEEPDFCLPVYGMKGCEAVLYLYGEDLKQNSLQQINEMKVISMMISDSYRAIQKQRSFRQDMAEQVKENTRQASEQSAMWDIEKFSPQGSF